MTKLEFDKLSRDNRKQYIRQYLEINPLGLSHPVFWAERVLHKDMGPEALYMAYQSIIDTLKL